LSNPSFEDNEDIEQCSNHDSCAEIGHDDFNLKIHENNQILKHSAKSYNGPISEKNGIPSEIDFVITNFLSFSEFYVRKSCEVNVCDMFFTYLINYCTENEECFNEDEIKQLKISKKKNYLK